VVKKWVIVALILISLSFVIHKLLDKFTSYSIHAISVDELLRTGNRHEKTFVVQGTVYDPDLYDKNRIDFFYLESKTGAKIKVFFKNNSLSKVANRSFVTIIGKCTVEGTFFAEQIWASSN